MPATRLSKRVLARLAQAEASEPNPHYRDDLQIAKLTVLYAASGEAVLCSPHVLASYAVLGLHPEKVWPAIQARRNALGPLEISAVPPKKPAQSVKLWSEKVNVARGANSRDAMQNGSPRTTGVPMSAAPIAALYRNSDAPSSKNKRQFSLDELKQIIHYSGAPVPTRALTIAALEARGPWPNQDGPATAILCISLKGMMLEGGVCKRTVQRRIKRACHLGFWRRTREANSWSACPKCHAQRDEAKCAKCPYEGDSKNFDEFRRPFTYELDLEKFVAAPRCREIHSAEFRSYADYKQVAGELPDAIDISSRKPAQPAPPPPPPDPAAPVPERAKPAAEAIDRQHSRRITRDEKAALFNAYIALKRSGMAHEPAIAEVQRQFHSRFSPEDIDYAVKIVGPPPQPEPEVPREIRCHTCSDQRLVLNLSNGPGQKRLIPCPECGVQSP